MPRALLAAIVTAGSLQCACSGTPAAKAAAQAAVKRDTGVTHEECALEAPGAERLDANGDGKPEVVIVREGGREVCRAIDLNFDGVMDSWVYLDESGKVRRREKDYDRDGRIDEITLYKSGVIAEKQRSTMLANHLDTWDFFSGGKLARTERDSNGDSVIDQWWEYPTAGCPVIHADVNSDGRPDPGASVDYCKETGYVPPERQDFKKAEAPNFQQSGTALPTELNSKEEAQPSGAGEGSTPAKSGTEPAKASEAPTKKGGSK